MNKVLIVNHFRKECGVQSFGKRVHTLVKDSSNVSYSYVEVETEKEFVSAFSKTQPNYILYNWHRGTMPWLSERLVTSIGISKQYFIFHDEVTRQNYDKYLFFGAYDFTEGSKFGDKKVLLPRPVLEYSGNYRENIIPTIGSFGFGFWNKGYHTLTKLVNDTFDTAILNFHMPYSYFGDPLKKQTREVEAECRRLVTNKGITLNINHEFLDDSGVLDFLAGNDINVFLYEENGEGISSVIDYALSVRRPIGISTSRMFRHIKEDSIIVGDNSIQDIISRGTGCLEKYYNTWSPNNFMAEMDNLFAN